MTSTIWLLDRGFKIAGTWDNPAALVHRADWIGRRPGFYAFVTDDKICYIGQTKALRTRLRKYGKRSFSSEGRKAPRDPHTQIRRIVSEGGCVDVYVMLADPTDTRTLSQIESDWIREVRPPWDRSLARREALPEVSVSTYV